jgi:hypothetical protein
LALKKAEAYLPHQKVHLKKSIWDTHISFMSVIYFFRSFIVMWYWKVNFYSKLQFPIKNIVQCLHSSLISWFFEVIFVLHLTVRMRCVHLCVYVLHLEASMIKRKVSQFYIIIRVCFLKASISSFLKSYGSLKDVELMWLFCLFDCDCWCELLLSWSGL